MSVSLPTAYTFQPSIWKLNQVNAKSNKCCWLIRYKEFLVFQARRKRSRFFQRLLIALQHFLHDSLVGIYSNQPVIILTFLNSNLRDLYSRWRFLINCERIITKLTFQSAPAGRETSASVRDWLELWRKTDRRYCLIERQRSFQLQQHNVVAWLARMPPVFGVWYHLRDTDELRITVIFAKIVHSDDDNIVTWITHKESRSHIE